MQFRNTLNLTKLYIKREWIRALVWLVIILFLTIAVAAVFSDLYNNPAERIGMAETMSNPAMVAMVGPVYGLDNYSNAIMYSGMMLLFSIVAVCVMNIFLVIRHTRKDEESGRNELIGSLPVGRLSNITATLIVCIIVNVLLGLLSGFGLYLLNLESFSLSGSLLYGACLGISGILFGVVAALFSQIASTSRGAMAYSLIFLGVAYLIRAIGDVSSELLAFISPLGLIMRAEVYYNNYWLPVIVILLLALVIGAVAFRLNTVRDLGAGLIAAKPGRSEASKFLQSPISLTLRLLKTTFIGWGITIFVLGLSYGSVFGDIEKFLGTSELMQQIFLNNDSFTFAEQFMTTLIVISAILTTVPVLIVFLKIRGEEQKGRLEHLYSKKISRNNIFANYLFVSLISGILFTLLFVIGLWGAQIAVMEEPIKFLTIFKAGMSYLPAIWLMVGIASLVVAFIPKLTSLIWGLLGFFFFMVYIGKMIKIPDKLISLTPFGSIPKIPIEDFSFIPLIVLILLSIIMIIISYFGYRKRDMIN